MAEATYPPTVPREGLQPGQTAVINGAPYRSHFGWQAAERAKARAAAIGVKPRRQENDE